MASKKKLPEPVADLEPLGNLGDAMEALDEMLVDDHLLLSRCLDVLVEVYNSPTLAMSGWESRRRRAKRPNPNLVSDMIRDLKAYLGGV